MLTPEQIDALRDHARSIADPLNDYLLEDIARRISKAGQLTGTAQYQIWRMQQLGMSQQEIRKHLQKLLKKSRDEINQLLTQSAEVGYRFDLDRLPSAAAVPFEQNEALQRIVSAAVELAQDDFTNITQTLGMIDPRGKALPLQEAYQSCMDFAFEQVATGAADYNTAIRQACKNLAGKGVVTIDYESGVHTSLEAATRRCVMGGLGLMQEQLAQQTHDELGCDGWEITAHANSAPDHEPIQGKQYSDAEYTALNNSLVRRIGTLNCGHAAFSIILGVSQPQYTKEELEKFRADNEKGVTYGGKHYTGYEATQLQRKLERTMRKHKRSALVYEAAGDADKLQESQIKLQVTRQEYTRFCKAAGLRAENERTYVAGFGRKEAAQARAAAKPVLDFNGKYLAKNDSELLPNYKLAKIPDEKVSGYALNIEHPIGKNKAVVFERILGYNLSNKDLLISRVRDGVNRYRALERPATQYGRPFEVRMLIKGANGRYAPVVTAWQIDSGEMEPRLVSLYVDE